MHTSTDRSRTPARSACRTALPLAAAMGVLAGSVAFTAPSATADPASAVSYVVGATPIALSQATDPELGSITPSADAATHGMFGTQEDWPLLPIHAALDRAGDLITFGTPLGSTSQGGLTFDRWTVASGFSAAAHADTATVNGDDELCNALTRLPDGRLLMVGGVSSMTSMIYDPATGAESSSPNLSENRWYATSLRLEDGRVLVLGGSDPYSTDKLYATTPEIGDGATPWMRLTGATSADLFGVSSGFDNWYYPRAFNAADDTVAGSSGDEIWSLDPAGAGSVTRIGTLPFNPESSGSQVMYAPGEVLVAGGGSAASADDVPGTSAAAVWNTATGLATSSSPMHHPRNWLHLTVLPTGTVWANGGSTVGMGADDPAQSVKQSEVWDPATGEWSLAATAQRTRTYHSTSVLLPSGAVFTGGSGSPGPENNLNAELYYPAYLFRTAADGTVQWAARPSITAIAGSLTHGGTIRMTVGDGQRIASASLISLASDTHSQNADQRRVPLTTTQSGDEVSAVLPTDAGVLPPGDYELTVEDADGVPSAAQIVTIRSGEPGLVTTTAANDAAPTAGAPAGTPTDDPGVAANSGAAAGSGMSMAPGGSATTVAPGGSATAGAGPQGLASLEHDASVAFEPLGASGSRVTASGSSALIRPISAASDADSRAASSWVVRTGLASSGGMSFESVQRPGYFLTAGTTLRGSLSVAKPDSSFRAKARATFTLGTAAVGRDLSLRSWADRSLYLRRVRGSLVLQPLDASPEGRSDFVFAIRSGLAPAPLVPFTRGASVGLAPDGDRGSLVRAAGSSAVLQQIETSSPWSVKDAATWIVHITARGISLESRAHRGWFLAAPIRTGGAMVLAKWSPSSSFAARTAFTAVDGAAGHGRTLHLAAHPAEVLTQSGSTLRALSLGRSSSARTAATFEVRTGLVRG